MMEKMTINDIIQTLRDADLILRPYSLFVNPCEIESVKTNLGNIGNQFEIIPNEGVEKGNVILVDRKQLYNLGVVFDKW